MKFNTRISALLLSFVLRLMIITLVICSGISQGKPIKLVIDPASKFSLTAGDRTVSLIGSTLRGMNFSDGQVRIVAPTIDYGTYSYKGSHCTVSTISDALKSGAFKCYPLHFHGSLNFINPDDELEIVVLNEDGDEVLNLPLQIRRNFLRYLSHDAQDLNRQCFDFLKETLAEESGNGIEAHCCAQFDFGVSDADLRCGEGVALFESTGEDAKLKHYALALGNGLYISKFGNGGGLYVSRMPSMLAFWGCNAVARVSPEALHSHAFVSEPFPTLSVADWKAISGEFQRTRGYQVSSSDASLGWVIRFVVMAALLVEGAF